MEGADSERDGWDDGAFAAAAERGHDESGTGEYIAELCEFERGEWWEWSEYAREDEV
jgi:hypothetical protein